VNLFTPEAMQRVFFETPEIKDVVVEWWHAKDRTHGFEADGFLAQLDLNGIDKIVIPAIEMWSFQTKQHMYAITVDEIAAVAEAAPDRIFGVAGINPHRGMKGVRELEEAVTQRGFVGGHVHAYGYGLPLNAREWFPFYAKCAELGVPVMMQVGHSAELMPSAVGRPILVDDIALYFPELKIVCTHTGWPWVEELIALAWKHPNVYIATTAHAPRYWDEKLVRFADSRGKDKVLFGTNWPVVTHDRALKEIPQLGFREESLRKLMRENALAVFGLDRKGARDE
jgi:hypothetical protein